MPLTQTRYGGECPLRKFEVNIAGGAGSYTADPVEKCIECNFGDTSVEKFELNNVCKCPSEMTWGEYDKLREQYSSIEDNLTKKGFWVFVEKNYAKGL